MKKEDLNQEELAKLETTENWLRDNGEIYNKVYWLCNDGDKITVKNNVDETLVVEIVKNHEKLKQYGEGLQAVMLTNGKLKYNQYRIGKHYLLITNLEGNEAIVAFLPAYNKI